MFWRVHVLLCLAFVARADSTIPASDLPAVREALEKWARGGVGSALTLQYTESAPPSTSSPQLDASSKRVLQTWVTLLKARSNIRVVRVDVFGQPKDVALIETAVRYLRLNGVERQRVEVGRLIPAKQTRLQLVVVRVSSR
jgi:hypothetical protein